VQQPRPQDKKFRAPTCARGRAYSTGPANSGRRRGGPRAVSRCPYLSNCGWRPITAVQSPSFASAPRGDGPAIFRRMDFNRNGKSLPNCACGYWAKRISALALYWRPPSAVFARTSSAPRSSGCPLVDGAQGMSRCHAGRNPGQGYATKVKISRGRATYFETAGQYSAWHGQETVPSTLFARVSGEGPDAQDAAPDPFDSRGRFSKGTAVQACCYFHKACIPFGPSLELPMRRTVRVNLAGCATLHAPVGRRAVAAAAFPGAAAARNGFAVLSPASTGLRILGAFLCRTGSRAFGHPGARPVSTGESRSRRLRWASAAPTAGPIAGRELHVA